MFAYPDTPTQENHQPLYKIPLSRATCLICDNYTVVERPHQQLQQQDTNPTTLVSQLERLIMLDDDSNLQEEEETTAISINQQLEENAFQLIFDNGDKIQFGCESLEERNKWVSVVEIMICRYVLGDSQLGHSYA